MTTLLIGAATGKRYSRIQVMSVVLLTVGCVLAALGDAKGMVSARAAWAWAERAADVRQGETDNSMVRFVSGLAILFIAQVLSAFMGLYIEETYRLHGNNYREGLFYTVCLLPDLADGR